MITNNPSQPSLGVTGRAVLTYLAMPSTYTKGGFLGGFVGKNPPAIMGDMGLILGPEICRTTAKQPSLCPMTIGLCSKSLEAKTTEPMHISYWKLCTLEPVLHTKRSHTVKSAHTATGEEPPIAQLERSPSSKEDPGEPETNS